jgi:DUF4097 and DUF4098 domain-containing protein YvlB
MPTFATPNPIDLAINIPVGGIEIVATDRSDSVVTVTPTNPAKATDVRGAEETTVEFDGSRLTIKAPKPRFTVIGPSESIEVRVELPTGSRLAAETSLGHVRSTGRLAGTRIKASRVDLDTTGDLWLRANHGNAEVRVADGEVEITADHGQIRIGTVTGDATLRASHGSIAIGESQGEVDAKLSYGDLEIGIATASVAAKTAYGSIRIGEVSDGSIDVETAYGQVTVGVRAGVATWLDLVSKNGRVRNALASDAAPTAPEQSVAVRARTQFGEVTIERAGNA